MMGFIRKFIFGAAKAGAAEAIKETTETATTQVVKEGVKQTVEQASKETIIHIAQPAGTGFFHTVGKWTTGLLGTVGLGGAGFGVYKLGQNNPVAPQAEATKQQDQNKPQSQDSGQGWLDRISSGVKNLLSPTDSANEPPKDFGPASILLGGGLALIGLFGADSLILAGVLGAVGVFVGQPLVNAMLDKTPAAPETPKPGIPNQPATQNASEPQTSVQRSQNPLQSVSISDVQAAPLTPSVANNQTKPRDIPLA